MSLFRKIFSSKSQKEKEVVKSDERGRYMPTQEIPIDESFTINFKKNGGKFLYCDSLDEVYDNLNNIILENNWEETSAFFYDTNLKEKFKSSQLKVSTTLSECTYFITTCENLIANDGSLLVCSNQLAEKKLNEFPNNVIVFATTSQIVSNIGEGLREIKHKNTSRIPTNITTIKHFKLQEEKDFLSYGSSAKNLYLLLLEDL
ncbi:LUD domain-containing protein [Psychroserpens sp. NJDZ02]|uniref:LUD domain-containing protein n=1 Tax=Psychroserpens sp. NJDZ02 TaxID=2570561 RepID=UPI0010A7A203|nr:LUD domain-containing protein [Psychroserpens sp. NJDZ02]QCE41754.1 lactate utilization protein B/C [Psychroserpens sp. NJDZ02]